MGNLAIVTDGSLIPGKDQIADAVVPFYVQYEIEHGNTSILSGQEVDQARFLLIQEGCRQPPTTSAPNLSDFIQTYERLYACGYTDFLVLTVPENYSGTFANAKAAFLDFSENHTGVRIKVIDTGTTVAGVKYLAEEAVRLRDLGLSLERISEKIEAARGRIELFVTFDTLKYIGASGRVAELAEHRRGETAKRYAKGIAAKLVALAHHSPKLVLSVRGGHEKILGFSLDFNNAVNRMTNVIEERELDGEIRRCYLYQSQAETEARKVSHRLNYDRRDMVFSTVEIVEETEIPLALLAVTGPKLVAAVCIYDK